MLAVFKKKINPSYCALVKIGAALTNCQDLTNGCDILPTEADESIKTPLQKPSEDGANKIGTTGGSGEGNAIVTKVRASEVDSNALLYTYTIWPDKSFGFGPN